MHIKWLNLRRSALKVKSEKANWGQGFQKCRLFLPPVRGHVTRRMSFYKKSWSLNPMVRAVFTPEAELTLFLRMRTKEIAKT